MHPSGEAISWERDSFAEPVRVDGRSRRAVAPARGRYSGGTLLAQRAERHNTAQALGGALRRSGWDTPQIKLFVDAVADASGDEEPKDRM